MAERTVYHVVPNQDEGWKVELEGASQASSTHQNKDEAVERARELAQDREPSQIIIHREDGTIQEERTYG